MCTLHAVVVLWVCLCVGCRFNEGEEVDEKGNAQLAELPEGLRALAEEVRELVVRSSQLAVVPDAVSTHQCSGCVVFACNVTVTVVPVVFTICDATVRRHTMSYTAACCADRPFGCRNDRLEGRMAS